MAQQSHLIYVAHYLFRDPVVVPVMVPVGGCEWLTLF
jgi:hypothetical protein